MSIAENIKRIRLEHGLSQSELGKIAGVSDKAVSTWELGLKTPRMGAVEKMANYFGITKSAIVDDAPMTSLQKPVVPPGFMPMPEMVQVPLIGSIACGTSPQSRISKAMSVFRLHGGLILRWNATGTAWPLPFVTVMWFAFVVSRK